ncbi:hypothetical protein GCM10010836_20510 [Aminobacter aminovorans]
MVFGLGHRTARMEMVLSAIEKSGAKLLCISYEGVSHRQSAAWRFAARRSPLACCSIMSRRWRSATCSPPAPSSDRVPQAATRLRGIETIGDALEEL